MRQKFALTKFHEKTAENLSSEHSQRVDPGQGKQVVVPADLPDDYYLINFRQLLDVVVATYGDLLNYEELAFASDFAELGDAAAKLYVRLLCRTPENFRIDKLSYPELGDLYELAAQLAGKGFLLIDPELALEDYLALFTKPELVEQILSHPANDLSKTAVAKLKREALIELYESTVANVDVSVEPKVKGTTEEPEWQYKVDVLQTCREPVFAVYKLCFFGNLYQDMTEFVLRDIGYAQYENYQLDEHSRAFNNREQLEAHIEYFELLSSRAEISELSVEELLLFEKQLPIPVDSNLERRVHRLRNSIARQLERLQQWDRAIKIYARSQRPPARERRVRVLLKQDKLQEAFSTCYEILDSPVNDEENQVVSGIAQRIARKLGQSFENRWEYTPPTETIEIDNSGDLVELQVATYMQQFGECFYVENMLFDAVFGLAFWDVIFAPIEGVFFNPFQSAPADFYDSQFKLRRTELLQQKFADLLIDGSLQREVFKQFDSKGGLQNPMVNWHYLDRRLLETAMSRIPLNNWLAIFRRLLSDTRLHRNGLPDLILFPHDRELEPYKLVEVKGPGDSIQKNQIRWMRFFADQGIPHQLCHVRWRDPS